MFPVQSSHRAGTIITSFMEKGNETLHSPYPLPVKHKAEAQSYLSNKHLCPFGLGPTSQPVAGRALDRDQAELGSNPSSPLPVTLDKSIPLLGLGTSLLLK